MICKQVSSRLGRLKDRGSRAGPDVEGLAKEVGREVQGGIDEGFGHVVDINIIASNLRADEIRELAIQTFADHGRDQPRRVFQRPINRIEPEIRARESLPLAVIVDQLSGGELGNRVIAVRQRRGLFARAGGVVAVFRGASRMNIAGNPTLTEPGEQLRDEVKIGPVDQRGVNFEGIGTISDEVEDDPRADILQDRGRGWRRSGGQPSGRSLRASLRAASLASGWWFRSRRSGLQGATGGGSHRRTRSRRGRESAPEAEQSGRGESGPCVTFGAFRLRRSIIDHRSSMSEEFHERGRVEA